MKPVSGTKQTDRESSWQQGPEILMMNSWRSSHSTAHQIAPNSSNQEPAAQNRQPRRGRRYQPAVTNALRATLCRIDLGVLDCPTVDQLLKLLDLYFADGDKMAPVE